MDLDSDKILSEVDQLLSKLDELPDNVRLQAFQKLYHKVSTSKLRGGGRGKGRGRGRPKGSRNHDQAAAHQDREGSTAEGASNDAATATTDPATHSKVQPKVEIKTEPEDYSDYNLEGGGVKLARVDDALQDASSTIVTGRRSRKINYRQLAEFGHNSEDQKREEDADWLPGGWDIPRESRGRGTRGRRRSRRLPHPVSAQLHPVNPPQHRYTSASSVCLLSDPPLSPSKENEQFDLLESCLKESGIKGGEQQRGAAQESQPGPPQDQDTTSLLHPHHEPFQDMEEEGLEEEDEEEEEEDREKTRHSKGKRKQLYVCDTLESVDRIPGRKNVESKFKCEVCGKMYASLSILKTHKIRHMDKKDLPFKCDKCDFSAASKIEIFRHSYKHTDSQLYVCEICGKTFARDTSLREHIDNIHNKRKRIRCNQCSFETSRAATMRSHLLTHEGAPPVVACPLCGDTFRNKRNLRAHLFSHAGAKPYECEECGKKFSMKNRLSAHVVQVHRPRTHSCTYCPKLFPTVHHLARHVRVHTGEKPYPCCFCPFSCNTQGNLIKHIRQIHDKLTFSYKDYLQEMGQATEKPKLDAEALERLSKEGQDLAQQLLPVIGEMAGCTLTLDELKEQVQSKKVHKEALLEMKQARRRRRIMRKLSPTGIKHPSSSSLSSSSSYFGGADNRKITLYTLAGEGRATEDEDDEDEDVVRQAGEVSTEEQLGVGGNLEGLGENQYLLTHTDETGCVMIIPWDVSLIDEEGDGEEEEEEGEWSQVTLPSTQTTTTTTTTSKLIKVEASDELASIKVTKDACLTDEGSIGSVAASLRENKGLPSMEDSRSLNKQRAEVSQELIEVMVENNITRMVADAGQGGEALKQAQPDTLSFSDPQAIIQVRDLMKELQVGKMKDMGRAARLQETVMVDHGIEKTCVEQQHHLPESIQVIASNEPVDDMAPNSRGLVLQEGYIMDEDGQVVQVGTGVLETGLLLGQMGSAVCSNAELTINKITSNVYSLVSEGQEPQTFVITTQEGEEEEHEEEEGGGRQTEELEVNLLPRQEEEEELEDRTWPVVLIVNADDLDKT